MSKKNLIIFNMSAYTDWEAGIQNRNYHIYTNLLHSKSFEKVFAIDFIPFTIKKVVKWYLERLKNRHKFTYLYNSFHTTVRRRGDEFIISSVLPFFSEKKFYTWLNKFITRYSQGGNILWSYNPMFAGYIKNIQHDKFVFDMIDYWVTHEAYGSYTKRLKTNYQKISEHASNIFAVASSQVELLDQEYGRNGHAEFIPNGIDVELFKKERQAIDELEEIKAHWDHIVGYIGTINADRVDLSMIEQAAKAIKKTHFYIAGPVWKGSMAEVERLEHTYQNIHFPGRVSRKDWASVAGYFDVAINPHKHTDFIQYTSPTKIFEYIAAGKPVVSTDVQGVRDLEEWVSIADDHAGFIKALQDEVSSLSLSDAHLRQAYAYKNFSWKDKVGHMLSKII